MLHERTSRYDPLSSCLVDFKGRANVASIKNCQFVESGPQVRRAVLLPLLLLHLFFLLTTAPSPLPRLQDNQGPQATRPDEEKEFVLQLGKTTEDCFNMDFSHPLSLLQAFAICICRFDAKLSW